MYSQFYLQLFSFLFSILLTVSYELAIDLITVLFHGYLFGPESGFFSETVSRWAALLIVGIAFALLIGLVYLIFYIVEFIVLRFSGLKTKHLVLAVIALFSVAIFIIISFSKPYNESVIDEDNEKLINYHYDEALIKFDAGDYEEALIELRTAEKMGMNTALLYVSMGNTYIYLNQFDQALIELNKAIQIDPNEYYAYFMRGILKYKFEDYEGAINDFEVMFNTKTELKYSKEKLSIMDDALNTMGLSHYLLGETDRACVKWYMSDKMGNEEAAYYIENILPR